MTREDEERKMESRKVKVKQDGGEGTKMVSPRGTPRNSEA